MPAILEIKEAKLITWESEKQDMRPVVAVSLGCHLKHYALPHVDPKDRDTVAKGIKKRFLSCPPKPNPIKLRALRRFVRKWVRANLDPLNDGDDLSFESWLAHCSYPAWRKEQLQKVWDEMGGIVTEDDLKVKSFVKDEHYLEWKHARLINARTDAFKCYSGPLFSAIEKRVFSLPYFIKKISMDKRAKYIIDLIYKEGVNYMMTDYTAFETHFTKEMMEAVEFELYSYMTEGTSYHSKMLHIMSVLSGLNVLQGETFRCLLDATRMSGEMNTSLGNGFSNLMFMLFVLKEKGCTNITGVIEGDDGLFSFYGPIPTPKDFAELGLTIKLEATEFLNEASFCGMIFDVESFIPIADPFKVLASFGWTKNTYAGSSNKKLLGLLRSKSMNVLFQYQNSPIFQALARYGLRVTSGIRAIAETNRYWAIAAKDAMEFYNIKGQELLALPVPMSSRMLMEKKFGLTIAMQIEIENYLDNHDLRTGSSSTWNKVTPIDLEILNYRLPIIWREYFDVYHINANPRANLSRKFYCFPINVQ